MPHIEVKGKMNYLQAVDYINNLGEFSYDFNLTGISTFLNTVGNPQNKLKVIHVAGTNGKGSVCAYISTILQMAGFKVGLYTSPHLLDIRERIQINRIKIPKKDFGKITTRYSLLATRYPLTYFEFLTAMAFWYFEKEKVDFAVIETGLGGRLDATNIIENTLVSVITNISLEHTQYLGNTVEKIAKEKAGIIKNNSVVITGAGGVALRTIEKVAKTRNVKVVKTKNKNYKVSLFGEHQKQNANLAAAVCRFLGIPEKHIIAGLRHTIWPGRFEIKHFTLHSSPFTVVIDCAHNPSGITALKKSIEEYFGKKINLVFGVLKDKNYKEMIKIISPLVRDVFISAPKNERALNPKIIEKEFAKYIFPKNIFVFDDIKSAVEFAKVRTENFCVTGSIYTVAEGIRGGRG